MSTKMSDWSTMLKNDHDERVADGKTQSAPKKTKEILAREYSARFLPDCREEGIAYESFIFGYCACDANEVSVLESKLAIAMATLEFYSKTIFEVGSFAALGNDIVPGGDNGTIARATLARIKEEA